MTSCIARVVLAGAALAWTATACGADYAAERARLKAAAPQDVTLHALEAGLAAFSEGNTADATALFDQALTAIEGMYANTENAARARSLWYEEGAKDFKGEPYERAMAYWYRGLLYLTEGDYENARASFRSGILQDAFAEEEQNRADFASLMALEGWANQLNGDNGNAADAYREVRQLRPGWVAPPAGANLLVVVELAGSPRKLGDGIGNHEIVYRKAKRTPETAVTLLLDGSPVPLARLEDLYYQATTRGGRPIDRVIAGKVAFRDVAGTIGDTLGTLASEGSVLAAAGTSGGHANALGGLAAIGAISSIISINVKPRADVRYWANLPETLYLAMVRAPTGPANVSATFTDGQGQPVDIPGVQLRRWTDKKGNGIVWMKTRQ